MAEFQQRVYSFEQTWQNRKHFDISKRIWSQSDSWLAEVRSMCIFLLIEQRHILLFWKWSLFVKVKPQSVEISLEIISLIQGWWHVAKDVCHFTWALMNSIKISNVKGRRHRTDVFYDTYIPNQNVLNEHLRQNKSLCN